MTNFDNALRSWITIASSSLAFGEFARAAVEQEDKSIRDISIALCGNCGLEDRISRYIQAAKWDRFIWNHDTYRVLYEDMRDWLTVTHFTELWRMFEAAEDKQDVLDTFELCFVRAGTEIQEARPVEWLRAQRRMDEPDVSTWRHKLWKLAAKALPMFISELERKGRLATARDRIEVFILKAMVKRFTAEAG